MPRSRNISPQTRSVIAALLELGWCHGYELSKRTGLKSGTLYPLLMRLGEQGLLESKWESSPDPGRPPRHVYRLSLEGAALARRQAAEATDGAGGLGSPIGQT